MEEQKTINLKCSNCGNNITYKSSYKIISSIIRKEYDVYCSCGSVLTKTEKKDESVK